MAGGEDPHDRNRSVETAEEERRRLEEQSRTPDEVGRVRRALRQHDEELAGGGGRDDPAVGEGDEPPTAGDGEDRPA